MVKDMDCLKQKKPNSFKCSMSMAIVHIIRFFIFAKITKWPAFFEKRKQERVFFTVLCNKKKQLKSKFEKVLDMRYSCSCKEYVVKIS